MTPKRKSSLAAFFLCAALLTKTIRSFAQEDDAQYRKEFYREDANRMSVDTDTGYFDIGLGSHVRLQGQVVFDAISGATPTGAPPPDQWRYADLKYFYNQSYNGLFQATVNDPNNLILYQSGYFPSFQAYTNYIAANYGQQISQQASNNAAQSFQTLTNAPNYRSSQVPLTTLTDHRRAFSLSLPATFGIHTITPQFSMSQESDYHSIGVALNYALQLNQKNTTINAGIAHTPDRVRDDVEVWESKVSDDFIVGVTQLLSPKSYLTLDFTYGIENGYLADPYRSVMFLFPNPQTTADPALYTEVRPRRRTKEIPYISYTQFIDPLDGSLELGYRYFHDSYEISAHTLEATWHQKIGKHLVFSPGIRYYYQNAAFFYNVIFQDANNPPQYYSSDYRLSNMETFTYTAILDYRIVKHFAVDVGYQRYIMHGLDGITSQSAYPSANVYSVGGRILF
jgi:hypothetical protein